MEQMSCEKWKECKHDGDCLDREPHLYKSIICEQPCLGYNGGIKVTVCVPVPEGKQVLYAEVEE